MSKLFQKIDSHISKFTRWAKKHKAWRTIVYIFVFSLFWPIIAGYYLARFSKRRLSKSTSSVATVILIGLSLLLNIGWIAAVSGDTTENNQQIAKQESSDKNLKLQDNKEKAEPTLYKIVSVTDGDTIKVAINGKTETLRLIGIDTPEVVDPRTTVQCFGQEASDHAKNILVGKSVYLEADDSQSERDKYDRLLRYVIFEDGTNFNKQMISDGYAYEYTYNVPYKYQQEFKTAQQDATTNSRGLWAASACGGQRTKPQAVTPTPAPAPAPVQAQPASECNIKGNISSEDEKIYHTPNGRYYDKTQIDTSKGERYFCSETEAQNAGWRASKL